MNKPAVVVIKSILFCFIFIGLLAVLSSLKQFFPPAYERYVYGIIGTVAALITTLAFVKFDRSSFAAIGLTWTNKTLTRFFTGILIGILLAGLMILLLVLTARASLQMTSNDYISFLGWGLALLPLAVMEEIAFRGYPFMKMNKAAGVWISQIIIAIIFAFYHVIGGQPVISALLGPGIWSFVFGATVLLSGGIACATGLHFSANLVLAAAGLKSDFSPVWTIHFPDADLANTIGIILQLVLLLLGILATRKYLKRK